jgi:septum formation protein
MELVLASASTHRRRLLSAAGIDARLIAPDFDERALDADFDPAGPAEFALRLAEGKARAVRGSLAPGEVVLAGDQLAVLDGAMLTKPADLPAAVAQLMSMSGRSHDLVNGLVLWRPDDDRWVRAVDVHRVTMRSYDRAEAAAYVERFRPLDSVGAYRIEDDADLIESVVGSGDDGVQGLPIAMVREMLAELAS